MVSQDKVRGRWEWGCVCRHLNAIVCSESASLSLPACPPRGLGSRKSHVSSQREQACLCPSPGQVRVLGPCRPLPKVPVAFRYSEMAIVCCQVLQRFSQTWRGERQEGSDLSDTASERPRSVSHPSRSVSAGGKEQGRRPSLQLSRPVTCSRPSTGEHLHISLPSPERRDFHCPHLPEAETETQSSIHHLAQNPKWQSWGLDRAW